MKYWVKADKTHYGFSRLDKYIVFLTKTVGHTLLGYIVPKFRRAKVRKDIANLVLKAYAAGDKEVNYMTSKEPFTSLNLGLFQKGIINLKK